MKRWHQLRLRTRLILLYLGLLTFSVTIIGGYSYWNVRNLLVGSTANHLRARAKPIIERYLFRQPPPLLNTVAHNLACDLTSRNTAAVILDTAGALVASGKRLPEEPDAPPPRREFLRRALAGENEVTYQDTLNGEHVLVVLIPLRIAPGSHTILGVAQISTSLQPIREILVNHGMMLLLVVLIVLLVGGELGFTLISSNFRYLKQMAHTCQQIARGELSRRVEYPNSGDEIGVLAEAFNHMVDRLEKLVATQKRFVANAAHELRTPLTVLRGSLEVLMRGSQDDPNAVARLTRGMYQQVQKLIQLCEQLLGLSRLESSRNIQKQPVELELFFREFLQQTRTLVQRHPFRFLAGPALILPADPDMLNRILLNLLDNALRHTPEGEEIAVGWKLHQNSVEIFLSDRGEGIPPEELPYIFEPFYQGKKHPAGGTGLGLALVKAMVEAHGGTIRVESQPGKGTTFSVNLPLN